ncbi:hypothetical protein BJV82DRAFT_413421 [Fennellomyces sp. T-0311]|nr:hypothetical protein BJV82DRAFT_413421 [Fennellomyces sp. T-0311]
MHPFFQSAFESPPTNQSPQPLETTPEPNVDFQEPVCAIPENDNNSKRRREEDSSDEECEDNATECPICLKGVSNQGSHRLVATKCGHTFGESCILKWISEKQKKKVPPRCPNCGQTGPVLKRADIRYIITTTLIAYDTSDLQRIKDELEQAKKLIDEKDMEILRLKGQINLLTRSSKNVEALEARLVELSNAKPMEVAEEKTGLVEYYSYPLEYQQTGRSLAINSSDEMAVISVGSEARGYGLQRISLCDIGSVEYIPVHKNVIRDVKCSPFQQSLVLSTGLDKQLALTCMSNQHVLVTYPIERAGWSCAFDEADPTMFYCGLANNTVLVYDNRNTKTHLHQLHPNGPNAPIHSLAVMKTATGRMVLCSNTLGSYAWELRPSEEPVHHPLPSVEQDGYKPYSLSYDNDTQTTMISSRRVATPTASASTMHSLYRLDPDDGRFMLSWGLESTHQQIQLARTCHFSPRGRKDDIVACYANESEVVLRTAGEQMGSFEIGAPAMDIKARKVGQDVVVGALTEKTLHLYKYQ